MANVKISDLTGAAATTAGQEFEVNDALTSKKVTASQVSSFVLSNLSSADLVTLGITASAAELNILDGVTSTTAELNKLDGVAGGVVGTTDTQTLTNKTLTAPSSSNATFTGGITEETGTMPAGTTPAIDPANGTVQEWTLTGNSSPTDSLVDGEFVELLIQDGTAYTITWPTITWLTDSAAAPTLGLTTVTPVLVQKVGTTLYGRRTGDGG